MDESAGDAARTQGQKKRVKNVCLRGACMHVWD